MAKKTTQRESDMNTDKINKVKDEVAREYEKDDYVRYDNWQDFFHNSNHDYDFMNKLIDKVIELYHQRLCEEAGKELPDINTFIEWFNVFCLHNQKPPTQLEVFEWMKEKASVLLASKQGEIERLKAIIELKNL